MTYINTKRSHNAQAILLLLWVIAAIYAIIIAIITTDSDFYSFVIPVILLFFCMPSLYFIDIFLWHFFGTEIISVNDTELEIRKVRRLFKRRKKIQLSQIKDIYLWQKKVRDIHIAFAFWGILWQGELCIKYKRNKKYYIGMNLSQKEAIALREQLMQEIKKNGCTNGLPNENQMQREEKETVPLHK